MKAQKINHAKPSLYSEVTWLDLDLTDACDTVIIMGDLFVLTGAYDCNFTTFQVNCIAQSFKSISPL